MFGSVGVANVLGSIRQESSDGVAILAYVRDFVTFCPVLKRPNLAYSGENYCKVLIMKVIMRRLMMVMIAKVVNIRHLFREYM